MTEEYHENLRIVGEPAKIRTVHSQLHVGNVTDLAKVLGQKYCWEADSRSVGQESMQFL